MHGHISMNLITVTYFEVHMTAVDIFKVMGLKVKIIDNLSDVGIPTDSSSTSYHFYAILQKTTVHSDTCLTYYFQTCGST